MVVMKSNRYGEKLGWTAGWIGGFIWVAILSIVFLCQDKIGPGAAGMSLTAAAIIAIFSFAPWRNPSTPYWKLMLAPYAIFFLSIAWAIWSFGGIEPIGFNWWNLLWLIPALSPVGMFCNRRWAESETRQGAPPNGDFAARHPRR